MRAMLCALCLVAAAAPCWAAEGFQRVPYSHPGLTGDRGVGLWAWPLPMDGDGDLDLVAGAEDGCCYHLKNPYLIAIRPRGAPETHMVAAWDFEEGGGGPLADKATLGAHADTLQALGGARVEKGVGIVPGEEGCAFRAAGTPDLAVPVELTLWARVRVDKRPRGIMGLVDKRRFRNPEERSRWHGSAT